MEIIGEKKGYILHEVTDNNVLLCKILKEYDDIEDAKEDLINLLSGNTTERKIIKSNKKI